MQKHFSELGPKEGSQLSRAKHRRNRGRQHGDPESQIAIAFSILQERALPAAAQCTANIFNRSQSL